MTQEPAVWLDKTLPFSDKFYFIAAVLDPRFFFHWIDVDVQPNGDAVASQKVRCELKEKLQSKNIGICLT